MFRRLPEANAAKVRVVLNGTPVAARAGDSVAAVLLLAGLTAWRHAPDGTPRALYCGMGVCFDCLVTIDGAGNRQACLTTVRDGMRIDTGAGPRSPRDEAP